MKLSGLFLAALAVPVSHGLTLGGRGGQSYSIIPDPDKRDLLQDLVTWDDHSLFIRGERAMMFSGELHPFRLPVPSLYLDLFQKIKAMGFNMVSFYVDWALLEGKPGEFRAEGVFALEPFFKAATEAGIYLLARPGPYINAEVSGGGYPGWLQHIQGILRTDASDYLNATDNYMAHVCSIIAKAQITNGGPVILFQPENEYTRGSGIPFPNKEYLQYVIDQARNAGIVVPLINNDAYAGGTGAPGTGLGSVDIYGHDAYPLGFDCGNPSTWPAGNLPVDYYEKHLEISPKTPFSLVEFQGGSFDPFGGPGFDQCSKLVNHEFARVFYKNNLAAGVTILNLYMIFGGTNWGNLGHPNGYTSYDYGASIREDRYIDREKYSEIKLEGQFLRVSPGYLTTTPGNLTKGVYSDTSDVTITPLRAKEYGEFFVVRHTDYQSTESASYTLKLPTSAGTLDIPQIGGKLTLSGRDSKIHVTDYPVGEHTLLYSTAEIFTWQKFEDKTLVIMYGGPGELHEFAIKDPFKLSHVEGAHVSYDSVNSSVVVQWETAPERQVIQFGDLAIYMLDRNSAYNYWVPVISGDSKDGPAHGSSIMNPDTVIVNGGYLVRSVNVEESTLEVKADFNVSTPLEIIGVPKGVSKLLINGKETEYTKSSLGNWIVKPELEFPTVNLPDLKSLDWHMIDSVPEIKPDYDDSKWMVADQNYTNNPKGTPLKTAVSLYGSDYGFNTGMLVFRGYLTSNGKESKLDLTTSGGYAYASSVWINDTFIGSYKGNPSDEVGVSVYDVPKLTRGSSYIVTILVDSNGLNENFVPGEDEMKHPRGILDYKLSSPSGCTTRIKQWKITGNLGGQDYEDKFRGPLNEGGLFFERQGYHLPSPPLDEFEAGSPMEGIDHVGVAFYAAKLTLDLPSDKYDIPIAFNFDNSTSPGDYRALLFVNGFQYGKYVQNLGPQTEFPVPEGILNHHGDNWIGVSVWALDEGGAKVPGLSLSSRSPVLTSRDNVEIVDGPAYSERKNAY